MQKLEPGICYKRIVDRYGSKEYVGQYIETIDDVYYFINQYQEKVGIKQVSGYIISNCELVGKLLTENCYKKE